MRFNPGDIVECVHGGLLLTKGKQYTVGAVKGYMVSIRGKYEDGSSPHFGLPDWLFKLVRTAAAEAKPLASERDRIPARKTDPSTSQHAAKPKRTGLRQQVFNVICGGHYEPRAIGWTGHEIAELLGVGLNSVTPRFAELRRAEQIKDSGQRREGQIVWVLA